MALAPPTAPRGGGLCPLPRRLSAKDLLGRHAIVSTKLISHFVKQFLRRHNAAEEHIYRLERGLVHPLVKRGVAVARECHLIVPEEPGPRRRFYSTHLLQRLR